MADKSVPVLWGGDLPETLDFYRTLGYTVTYEQTRPYTYGAVERTGIDLHFGPTPRDLDAEAAHVSCVVFVDEVEPWHVEFTAVLRARYGRIPARGKPRITRFKPGQSRFTVVDPVGNTIIYVQHGEPDPEYGGSKQLTGLAKVLDNAVILRDSKLDDKAAARAVEAGLRRFGAEAPAVVRGRALAMLAEIAAAAEDSARVSDLVAEIEKLDLDAADRAVVAAELQLVSDLRTWLTVED